MTNPSEMKYQKGEDQERTANVTWYRGEHTNFMPSDQNFKEEGSIEKYILQGWTPDQPFIAKDDVITAFGSCFAGHISDYLQEKGYRTGMNITRGGSQRITNSHVIRFGEGIVNTFAVRQQFEWAWEDRSFEEPLWHDWDGLDAGYGEAEREATRELFDMTDVFIITLGLSEIWDNKKTGEAFWRAIPEHQFDPELHGFRVSSVRENIANIGIIDSLITRENPSAKIIFTLSPVPLVATFRGVSCVTANSVSKSILRAAIDEYMRCHGWGPDKEDRLFYWPSYEIVREYFGGDAYEEDRRHIKPGVVQKIMELFDSFYLEGSNE